MSGPDFTHGGEFVDWPDRTELDEHFPQSIEVARLNPGIDVELVRWDQADPIVAEIGRWWVKQRTAIRRHVGSVPGLKVTIRSRRHTESDAMVGYVRFNRTRPTAVPTEVAS
jgi:hypothetical protein